VFTPRVRAQASDNRTIQMCVCVCVCVRHQKCVKVFGNDLTVVNMEMKAEGKLQRLEKHKTSRQD